MVVETTVPIDNCGAVVKSKMVMFCCVPSQEFAVYVRYTGQEEQLDIGEKANVPATNVVFCSDAVLNIETQKSPDGSETTANSPTLTFKSNN
jgi:hypothetical protein